MSSIPSDLIRVRAAAELCGVDRQTILLAIRNGRLAGYKPFGPLLVRRADLEALFAPVGSSAAPEAGAPVTARPPRRAPERRRQERLRRPG